MKVINGHWVDKKLMFNWELIIDEKMSNFIKLDLVPALPTIFTVHLGESLPVNLNNKPKTNMKELIPRNGAYNFMVCILAGSYMHIIKNEKYNCREFVHRNLLKLNQDTYLNHFSFNYPMILRQLNQDVRQK